MFPNLLLGLICLLLGASPVLADAQSAFDQANRQYAAADYAGAASAYERALSAGGARASVFYNLGNSYQRLGQYGHAILSYERARLLTPRDPDLLANLALARKAAAAFEEPGPNPRLDAALNTLSRAEWSALVVGSALFLGVLCVGCGIAGLPRGAFRQWTMVAAAMATFLLTGGATALYQRRDEAKRAVILTDSASIRLSPFENAEVVLTPGLGRTVLMGNRHGDFYYVTVPGVAQSGWLAAKDVAAIESDIAQATNDEPHSNITSVVR